MDTIVLKFGGSSLADNIKLNIVANKIIELYQEGNKIVTVVSAQGKTTDNLIKEAKELANVPKDRELDVLLSTGEQISISKLSILLNRMGYDTVSLTGWQAGIYTSNTNQNAKIELIDTTRIEKELENGKIVIVAGFQGINEQQDITTLGRGGSDTTAMAMAAALKAKKCYIYSDVDGVYSTDPNKVTEAKKLQTLSYVEMLDIAHEGARVLHNRCIEIGEKFDIPIITKSTFHNKPGSVIQNKIEDTSIKSIVKNDDIFYVTLTHQKYSMNSYNRIFRLLSDCGIEPNHFTNQSNYHLKICFTIKVSVLNKFQSLLENELKEYDVTYHNISRIAIVGYGIMNDESIMKKIMKIIEKNHLEMLTFDITESKISIMFKEKTENEILEEFHNILIE